MKVTLSTPEQILAATQTCLFHQDLAGEIFKESEVEAFINENDFVQIGWVKGIETILPTFEENKSYSSNTLQTKVATLREIHSFVESCVHDAYEDYKKMQEELEYVY